MKNKPLKLSPNRSIALGFLAIILAGALLLMLPAANRTGQGLSFLDSLFTATSATCVTGLVAADTWTQFNLLGQVILLVLIQVGGLGYMTMVLMASVLLKRKIGLKQRSLMMESVSAQRLSDALTLLRYILGGTAAIEGIGAVLLAFRFIPELGFAQGLWYAVFHSVSAFCNAGFDLMGFREPYSSLTHYVFDPLVNVTVCALVLLGGLGFLVWRDVWEKGIHFRRYSLHTKIMLTASAVLVIGGTALFWFAERDNLLAGMSPAEQALVSLFQAVSPRTAGFNTVDLSRLTSGGGLLTIMLMFIGAGPGSTGGGVKITTVAVCLLTLASYVRGRREVGAFNRRLDEEQIHRSAAGVTLYMTFIGLGGFLMLATQPFPLQDALFELFSAMSTVGLSTGITRALSPFNRGLLIVMMYCGRIGSLSMMMALAERGAPRVKDPVEHITIG
ncbi:MAG: Trk family potassium uptake protein [Clostridiales bacterium]|nr:Trk family potassium uptake protein [Clostridiales bacterium]